MGYISCECLRDRVSADLYDGVMSVAAIETTTSYGEVFTQRWVVESMLNNIGYSPDINLAELCVIEPSVGSGAFWIPLVEHLITSAHEHTIPWNQLHHSLRGFDLQQKHIDTCREQSVLLLTESGCPRPLAETLANSWLKHGDFLLDDELLAVDFVVGNPPYIRWDDLDPGIAALYRHLWPTMQGRADIYIGFFERGLSLLKPGGRLSFICADRWMHNTYGSSLRELVSRHHSVELIWRMHDVDVFESSVSAYPAIVQIANRKQGQVLVADCAEKFGSADAEYLTSTSFSESLHGENFKAHKLNRWFTGTNLWPSGDPNRIALLEQLNTRFPTIEATGARIGIGIATGADKAYIVDQDIDVEPDRKLPLAVSNDVRSGRFLWTGKVLLNPWDDNGQLINLDEYPKLAAEYAKHPKIKERYVAKKSPTTWFKTIDKVNPALVDQPKLLLQDMKAQITPVYEPGGHYPHHNLYTVTSTEWDLKVLGGLLLSAIAQAFVEAYGVKMRGGTLRFQSQYLRMIRVPAPNAIPEKVAQDLARAFDAGDREAATIAAERAYGLAEGSFI